MKRFASHYLYIPAYGFLKQYVIEINTDGYVISLYPLTEEAESILWTPGVIAIISKSQFLDRENTESKKANLMSFQHKQINTELPLEYNDIAALELVAVCFYPFDFTQMQPEETTALQVLNNNIL